MRMKFGGDYARNYVWISLCYRSIRLRAIKFSRFVDNLDRLTLPLSIADPIERRRSPMHRQAEHPESRRPAHHGLHR
jgi:hypothetical protein